MISPKFGAPFTRISDYSLLCLPMAMWWLRSCQLELDLCSRKDRKDFTHWSDFNEREIHIPESFLTLKCFRLGITEFQLNCCYLHLNQFGETCCVNLEAMVGVGYGRILTLQKDLAQSRGVSACDYNENNYCHNLCRDPSIFICTMSFHLHYGSFQINIIIY